MIDVADAFDPDFMTDVVITRHASGSYVDSVWVDGSTSNIDIQAVISQPTPDELKVLPEGLRTEGSIKLHSISLLQGVSEENKNLADTFTYRNKPWRIYHVFDQAIGNYYKAIAIRDNA